MSEQKRRFFAGNTLQQAVLAAASYHGIPVDEVDFRAVEKKHGFLKVARRAVIEVDPERPRRAAGAAPRPAPPLPPAGAVPPRGAAPPQGERDRPPQERPRREAPPQDGLPRSRGERGERRRGGPGRDRDRRERTPAAAPRAGVEEWVETGELVSLPEEPRSLADRLPRATGEEAEAAREALGQLLGITGLDLEAVVLSGAEGLVVELSGPHSALLTAENGELLLAIEHLLPRVMRGLGAEEAAIRVDCGNFQELREERLRSLAQRVAEEVRRSGRPRRLSSMNPADRRVIHLTIADEPGVISESEGEGFLKRVRVEPE